MLPVNNSRHGTAPASVAETRVIRCFAYERHQLRSAVRGERRRLKYAGLNVTHAQAHVTFNTFTFNRFRNGLETLLYREAHYLRLPALS